MIRSAAAILALAVAGCANPGIVRMTSDTYMLARKDYGGAFGNDAALVAGVVGEAAEFAESKGMAVVPINLQQQPHRFGGFGSVNYQFMLVPKDDPRARAATLSPVPQTVIEDRRR